jgi:hypothetical protein
MCEGSAAAPLALPTRNPGRGKIGAYFFRKPLRSCPWVGYRLGSSRGAAALPSNETDTTERAGIDRRAMPYTLRVTSRAFP